MSLQLSLALIGFGEAGETFARAAAWRGHASAFDIDPRREPAIVEHGLRPAASAADALQGADLVLSLVTADQALQAAQDYAPHLPTDALWCDLNSVSPQTKQAAARAVCKAGGRYVDVAVMAPVQPATLAVPLLLAGPDAGQASEWLGQLGFTSRALAGDEIGRAASIKLCRSIMVKGMEALCVEMALAATRLGVLEDVLASLDASEKPQGWHGRTDYSLDRMLLHGERRGAELREASTMLSDLGITPLLAEAVAQWQQDLGELGLSPPENLADKLAAIMRTPHFGEDL